MQNPINMSTHRDIQRCEAHFKPKFSEKAHLHKRYKKVQHDDVIHWRFPDCDWCKSYWRRVSLLLLFSVPPKIKLGALSITSRARPRWFTAQWHGNSEMLPRTLRVAKDEAAAKKLRLMKSVTWFSSVVCKGMVRLRKETLVPAPLVKSSTKSLVNL